MASEGDIVEFVGTSGSNSCWKCKLGEVSHRHEGRIRVKLGTMNGWRFIDSECLEHPNHLGPVASNRRMTVVYARPRGGTEQ